MDEGSRAAQGMAVRREVLGDAHVDRAMAGTTVFSGDFQELIARYAWGDIWSRPGALTDHAIAQYSCPYLARLC